MNAELNATIHDVGDGTALDACLQLVSRMDPGRLERCYGTAASAKRAKIDAHNPLKMLLKMSLSSSMQRVLEYDFQIQERFGDGTVTSQLHSLLEMDAHVQKAFETFGSNFPTAIWTCCSKRCFALTAILPENSAVFNVVLKIHNRAEALHDKIDGVDKLVRTRRRGYGRSSIACASKGKPNKKAKPPTDRQQLQRILKEFITGSLPYLRAEVAAPDGTLPPRLPFCIQAICQILGVQRSTLYKPVGGENCVIDNAGVRQRKFRRVGIRKGFRAINELSSFQCGCEMPCFSGLRDEVLQRLWDGFKVIAGELSPEEKERRYLMNQMFCPLTNTSVRVCNAAIAQLYTISEPLVASIRLLVHQMCEDPAIEELPVREHGMKRYRERHHPLNRFPEEIIERVESHLEMILRPDPAAADGINVCRVYSPEVNTQEKLRKLIANSMRKDVQEIRISPTSLQRMVKSYLEARGCRISFTQADHNAFPMYKSYHCEILYLHYEKKQLSEKLSPFRQLQRPMIRETQESFDKIVPLMEELKLKKYREREATYELRHHNERDASIRGWLKVLTDHLREEENKSREKSLKTGILEPFDWCRRRNYALVTHQDDMTRVDLPHVVVDASADITRWLFDVNAHVNAVTGDCIVFSHEQGAGSKNASSIIELILLDHILSSKGENIKVLVSDNASVGKNWLSTVVFPQYLVDQGLAEIVIVVFLENNHGKWLADMLFGQFQIRKRNSTILDVDGLLQEFETINRPSGSRIKGYAVNTLGCVDFAQVFAELGYETKPLKDFGFKNRNVHFAAACRPEARAHLTPRLQKILVNALPEEAGMVRLCSETPDFMPNSWRSFEGRWIDVPAASRSTSQAAPRVGNASNNRERSTASSITEPPLVVPVDKGFAANGPGVVSKRTAEHVGFNGLSFRGKMYVPELESESYVLTKEAWPPGLLLAGESGYESESLCCAPENWLLRRPVKYFGSGSDNGKARYPPRNLLNALYCHGPRAKGISVESDETVYWIPTATYSEAPVPIEERCSATQGLKAVAKDHQDNTKSLHFLQVLRYIYEKMGDRKSVSDPWLQKPATRPSCAALERYSDICRILKQRDNVRPPPALNILQAFREDKDVQVEIENEMEREGRKNNRTTKEIVASLFEARMIRSRPEMLSVLRKEAHRYEAEVEAFSKEERTKRADERELRDQEKQNSQSREKVTARLFEKRKLKPGALDRYRRLVEQDKQRYAGELKVYKEEAIVAFDKGRNLLPVQGPLPRPPS